ncbi:SGNH hydrolase domain-containing protein [Catenulispora yoronensis]
MARVGPGPAAAGAAAALIIVTELNWYAPAAETAKAWDGPLAALAALGVPIAGIHDTPKPDTDIPVCVSGAQERWQDCAFNRSDALAADPLAADLRVTPVDFSSLLCPDTKCPAVLDGVLLYRDDSHLTNAAAYLLAARLGAQLPFAKPWSTVYTADFQGPRARRSRRRTGSSTPGTAIPAARRRTGAPRKWSR